MTPQKPPQPRGGDVLRSTMDRQAKTDALSEKLLLLTSRSPEFVDEDWTKYDGIVDAMPIEALRRALKTEARLRARSIDALTGFDFDAER